MDHPDISPELNGVHGAIGIASMSKGEFVNPWCSSDLRLRVGRKAAIREDGQRIENLKLNFSRKIFKRPPRRANPGDSSVNSKPNLGKFVNNIARMVKPTCSRHRNYHFWFRISI